MPIALVPLNGKFSLVQEKRMIFDFFFAAGMAEDFMRESVVVTERVPDEDIGVCEEVQRNLNRRSYIINQSLVGEAADVPLPPPRPQATRYRHRLQ